MIETTRADMFTRDYATVTAAMLFAFFGSVACGAEEHVVFSQPDVSDIGERVYVIERRPLGEWFMISWQKSPFTADGKFVPVDWDPGEKTGLSIPDVHRRRMAQRGMQNAAGSTVCQMYGDTVGAYLNSADLSGNGVDANGNPLPGSDGYKQMITPSYMFGPEEAIHPWRAPDSRLQVSLDLQIPTAVCAEKKGSLAYANPLLTLVDPKTKLKISWGPMLFSKRSKGDRTKPMHRYRLRCSLAQLDDQRSSGARGFVARIGVGLRIVPDRALARLAAFLLVGKPRPRRGGAESHARAGTSGKGLDRSRRLSTHGLPPERRDHLPDRAG